VINLFEEARAVELDERLGSGSRGHHSPADLLRDATAGGAAGLGWADLGRLETGAGADFITVRIDGPALAGTVGRDGRGAAAAAVFAGSPADVTNVVVGGQTIVADGRHRTLGEVGPLLSRAIAQVLAD
jgi:cytosine/adenosine deaminase-related metal-dependent hydrolase